MKYILGTKEGMSQFFTQDGKAIPVTVISAGPVTVTQVKTTDADGYSAVQVGYGAQQKGRIGKARLGQMKDMGSVSPLERIPLQRF
jgi:large subunit ribosomal protein L3